MLVKGVEPKQAERGGAVSSADEAGLSGQAAGGCMTRTLDGVQSRVCVGGVLGNTFVLFLIYCVLFSLNNCIPSVEASRTRMCVCVCMCVTTE